MVQAQPECGEAAALQVMSDRSQRIAAVVQAGGLPRRELVDSGDAECHATGDRQRAADRVHVHRCTRNHHADQISGDAEKGPDEEVTAGEGECSAAKMGLSAEC